MDTNAVAQQRLVKMLIWTGIKYCDRLKGWLLPVLPSSATKLGNVGQLTRALSACFALKSYDNDANSLISNITMPSLRSIHSLSSWWKSMLMVHMRKRCRTTSQQRHRGYKQQTLSKCQYHHDDYNRDNHNNKSRSKRTLHGYALLASAAGIFSWDDHRITDEELRRYVTDLCNISSIQLKFVQLHL